ncbi:MAG: hypothetical protein J6Y29_05750 [Clostridiales bacterium]|nr:hypothetical protein [Clostridiales bacterium]
MREIKDIKVGKKRSEREEFTFREELESAVKEISISFKNVNKYFSRAYIAKLVKEKLVEGEFEKLKGIEKELKEQYVGNGRVSKEDLEELKKFLGYQKDRNREYLRHEILDYMARPQYVYEKKSRERCELARKYVLDALSIDDATYEKILRSGQRKKEKEEIISKIESVVDFFCPSDEKIQRYSKAYIANKTKQALIKGKVDEIDKIFNKLGKGSKSGSSLEKIRGTIKLKNVIEYDDQENDFILEKRLQKNKDNFKIELDDDTYEKIVSEIKPHEEKRDIKIDTYDESMELYSDKLMNDSGIDLYDDPHAYIFKSKYLKSLFETSVYSYVDFFCVYVANVFKCMEPNSSETYIKNLTKEALKNGKLNELIEFFDTDGLNEKKDGLIKLLDYREEENEEYKEKVFCFLVDESDIEAIIKENKLQTLSSDTKQYYKQPAFYQETSMSWKERNKHLFNDNDKYYNISDISSIETMNSYGTYDEYLENVDAKNDGLYKLKKLLSKLNLIKNKTTDVKHDKEILSEDLESVSDYFYAESDQLSDFEEEIVEQQVKEIEKEQNNKTETKRSKERNIPKVEEEPLKIDLNQNRNRNRRPIFGYLKSKL